MGTNPKNSFFLSPVLFFFLSFLSFSLSFLSSLPRPSFLPLYTTVDRTTSGHWQLRPNFPDRPQLTPTTTQLRSHEDRRCVLTKPPRDPPDLQRTVAPPRLIDLSVPTRASVGSGPYARHAKRRLSTRPRPPAMPANWASPGQQQADPSQPRANHD